MQKKGKRKIVDSPRGDQRQKMKVDLILIKVALGVEAKRKNEIQRVEQRKREKQRFQEEKIKLQKAEQKLKEEREQRRKEKEEKQKQEEEERQGMMVGEKTPIQVEEQEHNQPKTEEEGENVHDQDVSQQIGHLIEVTDMEMEQELHNEDVDLMPSTPQVIVQSPPPSSIETTLSKEGDVVPLDDDSVMDVYKMSLMISKIRFYKQRENIFRIIIHHLHSLDKG